MSQINTSEGSVMSVDYKLQKFSESLTRFDARLRGLESQFKSTTRPTLFQKNYQQGALKMNTTHNQDFSQFLRTGEFASHKSLSTEGPAGSITLPQMHHEIVDKAIPNYSPLRRFARTTTVTTDALELLIDQGGGDVGWVQERDVRDETVAPELTKLRINTHEMYARPQATQKLLDDVGVDLETWLTSKIAWQMGRMENRAFILGDGEMKPKGFLTYPLCKVGEGKFGVIESVQTNTDGRIEDPDALMDIFHAMKPEYLEGAIWMMSRATLNQVRKLKDKQGNYLYHMSPAQGDKGTLLGHEIVMTDDMPMPEKDSTSIVFANFAHAYQIVERQDIQVLRDPYSAKPYIEFYATKRVGGDVVNFDAIKVLRFSQI